LNALIEKEKENLLHKKHALMPAAFVSFKSRWGAAVAAQTQQTRNPQVRWLGITLNKPNLRGFGQDVLILQMHFGKSDASDALWQPDHRRRETLYQLRPYNGSV
jgi:hypothetical protein